MLVVKLVRRSLEAFNPLLVEPSSFASAGSLLPLSSSVLPSSFRVPSRFLFLYSCALKNHQLLPSRSISVWFVLYLRCCLERKCCSQLVGPWMITGAGGSSDAPLPYLSCMSLCMSVQILHSFFSHDSSAETALAFQKMQGSLMSRSRESHTSLYIALLVMMEPTRDRVALQACPSHIDSSFLGWAVDCLQRSLANQMKHSQIKGFVARKLHENKEVVYVPFAILTATLPTFSFHVSSALFSITDQIVSLTHFFHSP